MGGRLSAPTDQVSEWLSQFGTALHGADRAIAAEMFDEECYWRDLVSFTWNIKTLRGKTKYQSDVSSDDARGETRSLADRGRGHRE